MVAPLRTIKRGPIFDHSRISRRGGQVEELIFCVDGFFEACIHEEGKIAIEAVHAHDGNLGF